MHWQLRHNSCSRFLCELRRNGCRREADRRNQLDVQEPFAATVMAVTGLVKGEDSPVADCVIRTKQL